MSLFIRGRVLVSDLRRFDAPHHSQQACLLRDRVVLLPILDQA